MRSTDAILADMAALLDSTAGADLTDDQINQWETLDAELKASQLAEARARAAGDGGEAGGDGTEPAPGPAPADATNAAGAAARARATASIRAQHTAYNRVVVPAGRPRNGTRPQDTADAGFRTYLRTGQVNADLVRAPQNAQGTGTGSAGGFLVPDGFLNRIVEVVKTFGGVVNDAEQLTTDSGAPLPFPTNDDTGNQATTTPEGTPPSSGSDIVFGEVQLGAFEYTASGASGNALKVPIALIQDSALDIEAFIAKKLGQRIARKMAADAVNGLGTAGGQGILQGIAGNATASTTLDYDDLVDLITMHVDAEYWQGSKWYMNQISLGTIMKLEDDADQLIFKPNFLGMISDTNATQISGAIQVGGILAPVVIDPGFSTFGASAKWAAFGNMQEAYIWRQVRQIEVLVNPYTSANNRQIEYNAYVRADGRIKNSSAYAVSAGHS